jgi:hypothetical protein
MYENQAVEITDAPAVMFCYAINIFSFYFYFTVQKSSLYFINLYCL